MRLTELLLPPGGKGLVVGRNGSGKSFLALRLLPRTGRLAIIDPKHTVRYPGIPVYRSIQALRLRKPERFIWRPDENRLMDISLYNEVIEWVYQRGNYYLFLDDFGGIFNQGRFPPALAKAYMMGRDYDEGNKKLTILACIQRPIAVPRFVVSEAWRYYLFYVVDRRDVKTLQEYAPGYDPSAVMPQRAGGELIEGTRYRFCFAIPDEDVYEICRLVA